MTVYIANENGDWWEFNPNSPLFVMDTAKLSAEELQEIEDEGGMEEDKFESIIYDYGKQVSLKELIQ